MCKILTTQTSQLYVNTLAVHASSQSKVFFFLMNMRNFAVVEVAVFCAFMQTQISFWRYSLFSQDGWS